MTRPVPDGSTRGTPADAAVRPDAPAATPPDPARWLALGAVAGPVLFTLAWLVLGFLSPGYPLFGRFITPYSPISQPFSGLGLGSTAPYMNAAFVLGGVLVTTGVVGVFRTLGPTDRPTLRRTCAVLLALSGVGMVVDGVFDLEAIIPHMIGFLLGVVLQAPAFLVAGIFFRRLPPPWRRFGTWLLVAGPVTLLLVVLFFLTFDPIAAGEGHGVGGLTERVLVLETQGWFVAMGWLAFRGRRAGDAAPAHTAPGGGPGRSRSWSRW